MKTYEIIMGIVMLVVSVALIVVTLCQHSRGQGLAGAINDNSTQGMGGNVSHADKMLSRLTMIGGIVLFVVSIASCAVFSRIG